MRIINTSAFISTLIFISFTHFVFASSTMSKDDVKNVSRVEVLNKRQQQQISKTAGLLADYEIAAKKLVSNLDNEDSNSLIISNQAKKLLELSEDIIASAQFRLPQCNNYLAKSLGLKNQLHEISHEKLETDFHQDGALPKAPAECYHTKDLFVHPATVIVLTRDDPSLNLETKKSIDAEITEVLAHTELVRQLVIY